MFKQSFLIIIVLTCFIFTSCDNNLREISKEATTANLASNEAKFVNLQMLAQFKKMGLDERRIAYGLLSKTDKQFLWKEHIKEFLKQNTLTEEQKDLIEELVSKLSEDIFEEGSLQKEMLDYLNNNWGKRASKILGNSVIDKIANLKSVREIKGRTLSNGRVEDSRPNCDCTQSIFINDCDSQTTTCGAIPGGCKPVDSSDGPGCGWFGLEVCDLKCTQRSVPIGG